MSSATSCQFSVFKRNDKRSLISGESDKAAVYLVIVFNHKDSGLSGSPFGAIECCRQDRLTTCRLYWKDKG